VFIDVEDEIPRGGCRQPPMPPNRDPYYGEYHGGMPPGGSYPETGWYRYGGGPEEMTAMTGGYGYASSAGYPYVQSYSSVSDPNSLEARLEKLVGRNGARPTSPWATFILNYPWPPGLRVPEGIPTFNGESDPEEFVRTYQNLMMSRDIPEPLRCKLVGSYLRGNCLTWFDALPRESLRDYFDFSRALLHRYSQLKKATKPLAELLATRQKTGESVMDYYRRYMEDSMKVVDRQMQEKAIISGFINGLRDDVLFQKLMENIPGTFHQLQMAVELYCAVNDATRKRKEEEGFFSDRGDRRQKQVEVGSPGLLDSSVVANSGIPPILHGQTHVSPPLPAWAHALLLLLLRTPSYSSEFPLPFTAVLGAGEG
jgi:hypothetical protein